VSKNTEQLRVRVKKSKLQSKVVKQNMVSINANVEVNASVDKIWDIVSNVDRDSEYWKGLNSIQNTRREENLVEREIRLVPLGDGKTKLEVSWDFQFSKVPIFARGFVKSQIENVTKEALEKIAMVAEGTSRIQKVALVSSN
jgi:hypothetical protein